jgi:hypothetical protein
MIKSRILKYFEEPLYTGVVRSESKVYIACLIKTMLMIQESCVFDEAIFNKPNSEKSC